MTNTHGEHAPSPFLRGDAPVWYYAALTIAIAFITVANFTVGPAVAGWILIGCVVATFTTAHKVFPLAAAGTLTIFGLFLGLTNVHAWEHEIEGNLKVLLLIACMVPAIHFFRELLEVGFTALLLKFQGKVALSLSFFLFGAITSAFFDALTVAAMALAALGGMYLTYESVKHASNMAGAIDQDEREAHQAALDDFRAFLRQLLMALLVGTMCGGLSTLVGEPQNYQVGEMMKWGFHEYFVRMVGISAPVMVAGILVNLMLEGTKVGTVFGYGTKLPESIRAYLTEYSQSQARSRTQADKFRLTVQAMCGLGLITALGLQLASIGLLGLITMIVVSQLTGRVAENRYVPAYHSAMPFFALLLVFFGAVSIIHEQHLFDGLMRWIAGLPGKDRLLAMYLETGIVSSISDNVFVAVAHASNVLKLRSEGVITPAETDKLAIAIIAGTNVVSIATPNGQAAFLLAICSDTASNLHLRYLRMLWMAVPYTVVLSIVGAFAVTHWV
jgi:NhaB family Na+:H+ antiporter